MKIELQHGRRITDATGSHVEITTAENEKIILSHADVVQLLTAMNAASAKRAIAEVRDQRQD